MNQNESFYVFRNYTVENLFRLFENISFSDYTSLEDIKDSDNYIWFYTYPIKNDPKLVINEIDNYLGKLDFIINNTPKTKNIILMTISNIEPKFKFEDSGDIELSIMRYNMSLYELSKENSNIFVFNIDEFLSEINIEEIFDLRHYYLSEIVLSPDYSDIFSKWFIKKYNSLKGNRKKCIVLDLDNTLWGGILGEDLVDGIELNHDYPGKCYLDFQELLLESTKYGVILAICSKNNIEDVNELWDKHPYMKLQKENFSSIRINWNDKVSNIKEIANELNIGLNSLVFIDDNPRERELVKSMLPEVSVPDFPENPYALRRFFIRIYDKHFQTFNLTDEDKKKVQQYKDNAKRNKAKSQYTNIDDYIKDLDIKIELQKANEFNLPRIAQLTQKTNQFNLTTKRYTKQELLEKINNGSFIACADVSDKFGDNGITIGIIVDFNRSENHAVIDSYFLSCRILGRKIEYAFIKYVLNYLTENYNIEKFHSKYIPTKRNQQTSNFFDNLDFKLLDHKNNGTKEYVLNTNKNYNIKEYYNFKENL